MTLELSYGGLLYLDRTLPLLTGDVRPAGIDLTYAVSDSPGDLFRRQCQYAQFDVAELSASSHILMTANGDRRFVGLPIFVSRNFRHSQIYVHAAAGIERPEDLRGKRVGVFDYEMTAALWIRAFLQHDFGIQPEDMNWHTGGLAEPGWAERRKEPLVGAPLIERIPLDQTLEGMLAAGELDALITVQPPRGFSGDEGPVRRLFSDYVSVEREYFRRTGLFPIMHLVVVRRDLYESNPWIALALVDAFDAAKHRGMQRMRAITGLAVALPWLASSLDEVDTLFGGDAFPYGFEPNRHVLNAMCQYSFEQGLASKEISASELFARETLDQTVPI